MSTTTTTEPAVIRWCLDIRESHGADSIAFRAAIELADRSNESMTKPITIGYGLLAKKIGVTKKQAENAFKNLIRSGHLVRRLPPDVFNGLPAEYGLQMPKGGPR